MARKPTWCLMMAMVALLLANPSSARPTPSADKTLSDQKNFMSFTGAGTYYGVGNNGIPYGGVAGGAGTNGIPGFPGGVGAGGVIGTNPNGGVGGVVGVIPGGVVGFGGNTGAGNIGGSGVNPYP